MTEASTVSFEDVETYPELPKQAGGRGPGIGSDLEKCKAADILDKDVAVVGFLIIPNKFKNESDPPGPDEVTMFEILDPQNDRWVFTHASQVLMNQAEQREELGQIPFRTRLTMVEGSKGRSYYSFV
jgi:hypothetical protein